MILRIVTVALALLISFGVFGSSGPANTAPPTSIQISASETGTSTASGATVYNFYYDYFASKSTCDARGYALLHYEELPNMSGWTCVRHSGNTKWSMHVHYWSGGIE